MCTRVFSPTYPTWALVGGTSRPAGETVCICLQLYLSTRGRWTEALTAAPATATKPSLVLSISNMLVVTETSGLRPQLQFQGFWWRSRPLRLARGRRAGRGTEASRLWSRDNHSSLARPGCRSGQEMCQGSTKCGTITNVLCMSWSKASEGHLNVLF